MGNKETLADLEAMHDETTIEEHREHAEYIRKLKRKEEERKKFYHEVRKSLVIWTLITLLGALGTILWLGLRASKILS